MINTNMRLYDYLTLGNKDEYGQAAIPSITDQPEGQIKMSINLITQNIADNIKYENCSYVGLTKEKVDDTYIIFFENRLLKAQYVNPYGRYKQVFLAEL